MVKHGRYCYPNGIVISLKNKEMVHVHFVFVLVSRYGLCHTKYWNTRFYCLVSSRWDSIAVK